jgi:hypothetical protein
MQQNVDGDMLTNSVFPGPTGREKRIQNWSDCRRSQLQLALFTIIANSSLSFGGGADSTRQDPGISCEEGLRTKYKDHHSPTTPVCAQSSCLLSLGLKPVF